MKLFTLWVQLAIKGEKAVIYIGEQTPFCCRPFSSVFCLPAGSWEMLAERECPAKIGQCFEELAAHNFDLGAKSSREDFFIYISNILSGGFCPSTKIAAG